jgi:hypothetical protein
MARTPYDINASWDDPFERRQERRAVARIPAKFKIKIAVDLANKSTPLVGSGVVDDISPEGLRCRSKHRLSPGQSVRIMITTGSLPTDLGLPKRFLGGAQVVRTNQTHDDVSEISLRFDDALRDDIHLAVFIEYLQHSSRAASA